MTVDGGDGGPASVHRRTDAQLAAHVRLQQALQEEACKRRGVLEGLIAAARDAHDADALEAAVAQAATTRPLVWGEDELDDLRDEVEEMRNPPADEMEADDVYSRLVRPVDDEELDRINDAWLAGENQIVITAPAGAGGSNVDVLGKHTQRLRYEGWLFDEVVNVYMWLLQERDKRLCLGDADRQPSHFFNSFFFEKLFEPQGRDRYDYSCVKRWARKIKQTNGDIFKLDKMVIPVNVANSHWTLIVAFVKLKKFQYFDSMGSTGRRYLLGLKQYFKDEAARTKQSVDVDSWEVVLGSFDTPQQDNGSDCGVFCCTTAKYVGADLDLRFAARHMDTIRQRMTLEVLDLAIDEGT